MDPNKTKPASQEDDNAPKKRSTMEKIGLTVLLLLALTMIFPYNMTANMMGLGTNTNPSVGTLNGKTIRAQEMQTITQSAALLKSIQVKAPNFPQAVPLASLMDREAQSLLNQGSDGFFLAIEYARQLVPGVSPLAIDAALRTPDTSLEGVLHPSLFSGLNQSAGLAGFLARPETGAVLIDNQGRQLAALPDREKAAYAQALRDFLTIQRAMRIDSLTVSKASAPMVDTFVARVATNVVADVVEFNIMDQTATVPEPSDAQLAEQLKKYADIIATTPPTPQARSPLGAGYRLPNRVKLQAIVLPFDLVRQAVRGEKVTKNADGTDNLFEWEKAAVVLYQDRAFNADPANFGAFKRHTEGADQGKLLPWDQQDKTAAINAAIDAATRERLNNLETKLRNRLRDDWQRWRNEKEIAGAPLTAGKYLEDLALEFQKSNGVLPQVILPSDNFKDDVDLRTLDPLATGTIGTLIDGQSVPFQDYALQFVLAFSDKDAQIRWGDLLLTPFKPSLGVSLPNGGRFVFRLTAVDAARPAVEADLSNPKLKGKVITDWKIAQAVDKTRALAEQTLDAARKAGSLAAVPGATVRSNVALGFIGNQLGVDSLRKLADASSDGFALLVSPADNKVLVAQRKSLNARWSTPEEAAGLAGEASSELHRLLDGSDIPFNPANPTAGPRATLLNNAFPGMPLTPPVRSSTFSADNLAARLNWKPVKTEEDKPAATK
jgi:hypothetical protein